MLFGVLFTSKINFLLTITFRLEVQFVVFLYILITKNESLSLNSSLSNKTAIEMFVAMTEFPPYYELYSDWIYPNNYTNSSPPTLKTIPFRF